MAKWETVNIQWRNSSIPLPSNQNEHTGSGQTSSASRWEKNTYYLSSVPAQSVKSEFNYEENLDKPKLRGTE